MQVLWAEFGAEPLCTPLIKTQGGFWFVLSHPFARKKANGWGTEGRTLLAGGGSEAPLTGFWGPHAVVH
jgi:hypothetical protein